MITLTCGTTQSPCVSSCHPLALQLIQSLRYSGIDRPPQYTHITLDDIPGAKSYMEERQKADPSLTTILVGSCHCQAIKVALASAPAEESEINDCACSICLGVSLSEGCGRASRWLNQSYRTVACGSTPNESTPFGPPRLPKTPINQIPRAWSNTSSGQ